MLLLLLLLFYNKVLLLIKCNIIASAVSSWTIWLEKTLKFAIR